MATPQRLVPERADGLELIGEFAQSGYKEPPWLVRRADGETVQLTKLLYIVLEAIDGRRDAAAVARIASPRIGKRASGSAVQFLVEKRLRPLGLVKRPDGSNPITKKAKPLLSVRPRIVLCSARATRVLTAPFAALFWWPVVLAVVAAFAAMTAWLMFIGGVGQSIRDVIYQPKLLLLTFALTIASAAFHEFGHAAACRYSGARPGVMGAGLYLVWPVFYTDVTDSYRLGRAGRLRVDLGGVYFNAVFALATFAAWAAFGWQTALVLVPLQFFQMLRQLLPFVRLDGYHILADLTGVPDLFARIKPILLSVLPGHRRDERVAALKPWVRVVVTLWVLTVVPMLVFTMGMLALGLPRVISTAWESLRMQWQTVRAAFEGGQLTAGLAGLVSVLALVLPACGAILMLTRIGRRTIVGGWRRTSGRPGFRTVAGTGLAALAVGLAFLWWPNGKYQPIRADEAWTMPDLVAQIPDAGTARQALAQAPTAEPEPPTDGTQTPPVPGADDPPATGEPRGVPNRAPSPATAPTSAAPVVTTPTTGSAQPSGDTSTVTAPATTAEPPPDPSASTPPSTASEPTTSAPPPTTTASASAPPAPATTSAPAPPEPPPPPTTVTPSATTPEVTTP